MTSLRIATELEAYNIGGKDIPVTNRMVTKVRAEVLGCSVSISATENQLVPASSLSRTRISLGKLDIVSGKIYIDRLSCNWNWHFQWRVPLPEDMEFSITYWDSVHFKSVTRSTGTVSRGATYTIGNNKDEYDLDYAVVNGSIQSIKPKNKDYYFE